MLIKFVLLYLVVGLIVYLYSDYVSERNTNKTFVEQCEDEVFKSKHVGNIDFVNNNYTLFVSIVVISVVLLYPVFFTVMYLEKLNN